MTGDRERARSPGEAAAGGSALPGSRPRQAGDPVQVHDLGRLEGSNRPRREAAEPDGPDPDPDEAGHREPDPGEHPPGPSLAPPDHPPPDRGPAAPRPNPPGPSPPRDPPLPHDAPGRPPA